MSLILSIAIIAVIFGLLLRWQIYGFFAGFHIESFQKIGEKIWIYGNQVLLLRLYLRITYQIKMTVCEKINNSGTRLSSASGGTRDAGLVDFKSLVTGIYPPPPHIY
jgi:hypothetical protein